MHIHGNVATYHARSTGAGVDEATMSWSSGDREGERRRNGGERNPWEMTEGRDPHHDSDDQHVHESVGM